MKKFAKVMAVVLVAVMAVTLLVACGPANNIEDAIAALKGNGYATHKFVGNIGFSNVDSKLVATKGVVGSLLGSGEEYQTITIYYFFTADAAKEAFEDIQQLSELERGEREDWVCKRSGDVVYFGTKQAVKDAR